MKIITLMAGLLLFCLKLNSQTPTLPDIVLVPFVSGLNQPVGIEHAGDNRLFVVEQTGKIRIVDTKGKTKSHFLNISDKILTTGFEQGLLGLAFDPDYASNGYFYIHYTNLDGNSTFSRYRVNPHNPSKALPSSEVIMLEVEDPFANHNGGQMKFGPDGYLYFTIGDGGSGGDPFNNAQNTSTLLGKLLRIDPASDGGYDIPDDNPYAGVEGAMEEIWATGLRNPWRFSFDLLTGDLWIPDVGQNAWEEVNVQSAGSAGGENYGWSCMEGLHFFKADCDNNGVPFTDPVGEYAHSSDTNFLCSGSVTGGYIYRGSNYPDMYGKYIYTDFCTGIFRTTYWDGSVWVNAELGNFTPFAYSTFGEDISGELYVADKTSGTIYRVTASGNGAFAQNPWNTIPDEYADALADISMSDNDEIVRQSIHEGRQMNTQDVSIAAIQVYPNPSRGDFTLHIHSDRDQDAEIYILDMLGNLVAKEKKDLHAGDNIIHFELDKLTAGLYAVEMRSANKISSIRLMME